MAEHPHYHWHQLPCTDTRCSGAGDHLISFGPITGFSEIAASLIRHLGYDPAQHAALLVAMEAAIGDEVLQIGQDMLAERGLPVRDPYSGEPLEKVYKPAASTTTTRRS